MHLLTSYFQIENSSSYARFPPALLINYHDVQNVIIGRMNSLSRKHYLDQVSCELWIEYLKKEKNCKTLFVLHPGDNGPFLLSWVSQWQMKVSK